MALFTESQAQACIITKIKKIVSGSDCSWNIGFKDDNNIHYDFNTNKLSSSCSKSDIKAATLSQIQTMVKVKVPSSVVTNEDSLGVDETVG
tara:strand:+ start:365 stop:637 length:273 start_codon:yes stop_codon:yes gene_type:complete